MINPENAEMLGLETGWLVAGINMWIDRLFAKKVNSSFYPFKKFTLINYLNRVSK